VKPELLVTSDDDPVLHSLVSCISGIECARFFLDHLGRSQPDQKIIVTNFQAFATNILACTLSDIQWRMEYCPSRQTGDCVDIFGSGNGFVVAIELDKNRADQVAKKFVSRMAILPPTSIYFVSLCYPGTEKMNKSECAKYFRYCSTLAHRMGNHYAGFIIA
jgi:hypothetical protein